MSTEANQAANPITENTLRGHMGLTKREYFAAMAMQGILADPDNQGYAEGIAKDAVKMADELITQLNQTK